MKQALAVSSVSGGIALMCAAVFFLVPDSLAMLAFSGSAFLQGEAWRLLTFPFAHVSLQHLLENMMALGIAAMLSYEVGLRGRHFIGTFLLSGLCVALVQTPIVPLVPVAGASLGIYSVFGSLSIRSSNFIPKYLSVPLLGTPVFLMYTINMLMSPAAADGRVLLQLIFHLAGFVSGILLFYGFSWVDRKRKKRLLS